jgi:hypothetical protein
MAPERPAFWCSGPCVILSRTVGLWLIGCGRRGGMSLPRLDYNRLSWAFLSLRITTSGGNHAMDSPMEKAVWQGPEVACQQPYEWACKQIVQPQLSSEMTAVLPHSLSATSGETVSQKSLANCPWTLTLGSCAIIISACCFKLLNFRAIHCAAVGLKPLL